MTTYIENLTTKFHVIYVLNINIKFHVNHILFNVRSKNIFFLYIILDYKNLEFKHVINFIVINLSFSRNFTSMGLIMFMLLILTWFVL